AGLLPMAMRGLGRRATLAAGILALGGTTAAQAAIRGKASASGAAFAFGAANGWDDAVFYVLAMEASDLRMAASTYALFMAATNVSVAGGWLVAELESALGRSFPRATVVLAGLVLLSLAFIPALRRSPAKPEPTDGDA